MVDAPFLEILKVRLDLIKLKMSLQMTCKGPFRPKPFYDLPIPILDHQHHPTSLRRTHQAASTQAQPLPTAEAPLLRSDTLGKVQVVVTRVKTDSQKTECEVFFFYIQNTGKFL